jgi:hypothetical protein
MSEGVLKSKVGWRIAATYERIIHKLAKISKHIYIGTCAGYAFFLLEVN